MRAVYVVLHLTCLKVGVIIVFNSTVVDAVSVHNYDRDSINFVVTAVHMVSTIVRLLSAQKNSV